MTRYVFIYNTRYIIYDRPFTHTYAHLRYNDVRVYNVILGKHLLRHNYVVYRMTTIIPCIWAARVVKMIKYGLGERSVWLL